MTLPSFATRPDCLQGELVASGASSTCQFVIEGTLNDPAAVVLQRNALALDGLKGGLPEYIIPNCMGNGSITVNRVSGVNPEF